MHVEFHVQTTLLLGYEMWFYLLLPSLLRCNVGMKEKIKPGTGQLMTMAK